MECDQLEGLLRHQFAVQVLVTAAFLLHPVGMELNLRSHMSTYFCVVVALVDPIFYCGRDPPPTAGI
jgi:uncharacterized membrane protein YGL010W